MYLNREGGKSCVHLVRSRLTNEGVDGNQFGQYEIENSCLLQACLLYLRYSL